MGERRGRVLVAGEINTDLVGRAARAPEAGETVSGTSFAIFGGGKGANQAVSAARSGATVAMLGAVGDDDFGRQQLDNLLAEDIDIAAVDVTDEAASGVALIVVEEDTGQNRITYIPGSNLLVDPGAAAEAAERFGPDVVLSTLALPEPVRTALYAAARALGARVVVNATPEPLGVRVHLTRIDALIVNETEAGDLLGHPVTVGGVADAARALAAMGPEIVLITLGAHGALVLSEGEPVLIPAPAVKVVDTTGAGDACCGAFAARLAAGANPTTAARAGVVAGSLATTREGAQPSMPRAEEIDALLADT
jgi:ribokinase